MEVMRCAIYTKYGKGPQCPKQAAIGSEICNTHKYLEAKLGTLPRRPVLATPVETVPVMPAVELMAAGMTPNATTADPGAPVETAAGPVVEQKVEKVRKTRSDKGTRRKRS